MKKISTKFLILLAFITVLLFNGSTNSFAAVTATVTFGTQPPGGGTCAGSSICVAIPSTATEVTPDGIPVSFALDPANSEILLLTFKMSHLSSFQPSQAILMGNLSLPGYNNTTQTYVFDAPYNLNVPMYSSLNLAPNASIQPNSIITVTISGDIVTLHVYYQHD